MNLEQDMEYSRCQISCIELPKYPTYAMFIICNSATCIDLMDSILGCFVRTTYTQAKTQLSKEHEQGTPSVGDMAVKFIPLGAHSIIIKYKLSPNGHSRCRHRRPFRIRSMSGHHN